MRHGGVRNGVLAACIVIALSAACSSSSGTSPGASTDAAVDAPIPTGGGVCCPITGSAPCGCAGGGGWAINVASCTSAGTCDEWFDVVTDDHGCPALVANPSKCCGCPPPHDGGGDATVTDGPEAG